MSGTDIKASRLFVQATDEAAYCFSEACVGTFGSFGSTDPDSIGTLNEKRLHAAVKRFISPDTAYHEIKLGADSRYVADVLFPRDGIFEIQTGSFYPLKDKLAWYLENTPHRVTVVMPVPYERYLCWVSPEDGSLGKKRRSPLRGGLCDIARELYWIKDFIGDSRFTLEVLFIGMTEYRLKNGWDKTGKKGSERLERVPDSLVGSVTLSSPRDYEIFLPDSLKASPFTAKEYAAETGIRGKNTYSMLKILCALGIAEAGEKSGRSVMYSYIEK